MTQENNEHDGVKGLEEAADNGLFRASVERSTRKKTKAELAEWALQAIKPGYLCVEDVVNSVHAARRKYFDLSHDYRLAAEKNDRLQSVIAAAQANSNAADYEVRRLTAGNDALQAKCKRLTGRVDSMEDEIYALRVEMEGPRGFKTWKDAAVAERVRRVKETVELREGNDLLTQKIADTIEACARKCERRADSLTDGSAVARQCAKDIRNGGDLAGGEIARLTGENSVLRNLLQDALDVIETIDEDECEDVDAVCDLTHRMKLAINGPDEDLLEEGNGG